MKVWGHARSRNFGKMDIIPLKIGRIKQNNYQLWAGKKKCPKALQGQAKFHHLMVFN